MVLRVKPEKKEERERLAHALLRATLGLAAAHGFSSLGLREVARAADMAPTSFYRHFADMEALGLTLIEDLVGRFLSDCIDGANETKPRAGDAAIKLAGRVLARAGEDPYLMRFILAERVGAIASFRAALRKKLTMLSTALGEAFTADLNLAPASAPPALVHGAVALILDGCAEALEQGPETIPVILERLRSELGMLARGATVRGAS